MSNQVDEVIESYAELCTWWFGKVGEHASSVVANWADGDYAPDEVVEDLARGARLFTEGVVAATTKFMGAQEILQHDSTKRRIFRRTYPISASNLPRTLSCPNGLKPALSNDSIPSSAVFSDPAPIPAGATSFDVCIDATGHKGLPYYGHVVLTDGTTSETIAVEVAAT